MNKYASIIGWGADVPEKILTNDDLAQFVDTSDEWIRTRTGIGQRHAVVAGESTSTMAAKAAIKALEVAKLPAWQLDLIIVSTTTPDYLFPSTACVVQDAIGASNAAAFDLGAACSGFLYGLSTGSQFIRSGAYKNVLVIGADAMTPYLNWKDRKTCVLFGDGAGAVVLQASDQRSGLLSFVLGSQGAGKHLIKLAAGGSANPISAESLAAGDHYIQMSGNEVYQFAVRTMSDESVDAINRAGMTIEDISLIIPHQANIRIIESIAKRLDVPMDKMFVNIEKYGNTSAASIPIALVEAVEMGKVKPGDNLVFVAFGSGLTSGAGVVRWGWPD